MNKSLFTIIMLLSSINIFTSDRDELRHPGERHAPAAVFAASKIAVSGLTYNQEKGFAVQQGGKWHQVPNHLVDKNLRGRSNEEISAYLSKNFVTIKKGSNGQFSVQEGTRAYGGGPGGATAGFIGGKFIFSAVCHGTISLIATGANFIVPGSGLAVAGGLESVLAAPIEAASLKVGLATGIIVGAATGPF